MALLVGVELGMQCARGYPQLAQCRDLIVHQRDQRRNHDRGAVSAQRRNLVAHALAAPGRHQHKGVATVGHMSHSAGLQRPEIRKSEDPP